MKKGVISSKNLFRYTVVGYLVLAVFFVSLTVHLERKNASPVSSQRLVPIYRVERDDKCISLTVDAAWDNEYTSEIIRILDEYNVKITFFTAKLWADTYPDDIKALALAGHEIANHSATHPDMADLSTSAIQKELKDTWNIQKELAGAMAVRLFRAPFGSYSNTLIRECEKLGFYTVQWDIDSLDWKLKDPQTVIDRVLSNVSSGSIILMHNDSDVITTVLPTVLEALIKDGYRFVPVSQLIYTENFYIDQQGTQHLIAQ
ncbi:MAG: deacetylase [Clostridiales bacterium]|nr:deacetylase [Clostridiales bacterium]